MFSTSAGMKLVAIEERIVGGWTTLRSSGLGSEVMAVEVCNAGFEFSSAMFEASGLVIQHWG